MALECNIDSRGKAFRLKYGFLGVIGGFVLALALFFANIDLGLAWLIPAGLVGGGSFSIFEGWSGWCAARALGFRTSI